MDPMQLSMIQQTLAQNRANPTPTSWAQSGAMRNQLRGTLGAINDYRNPAVWAQVQQATAHMDPASKYLYAQAHHIPAAAFGMPVQTINYLAQSLMGFSMDRNTGQILQQNGDGSNTVVPNGFLGSAVESRNGADLSQTGGMRLDGNTGSNYGAGSQQWRADQANALGYGYNGTGNSNYSMNPADTVSWRQQANGGDGYGNPAPGTSGAAVSNLGGGAGNPNNAAGDPSLAGAGGNDLRQQFMDSQQFNPNGANTYAIQNMNLSGQGGLGSNMGGVPSNGLFGGAVSTPSTSQQTSTGGNNTSGSPLGAVTDIANTPSSSTGTLGSTTGTLNTGGMTPNGTATPQTTPTGTQTPSYFNSGTGVMPSSRPAGYTGTRQQYMTQNGIQRS